MHKTACYKRRARVRGILFDVLHAVNVRPAFSSAVVVCSEIWFFLSRREVFILGCQRPFFCFLRLQGFASSAREKLSSSRNLYSHIWCARKSQIFILYVKLNLKSVTFSLKCFLLRFQCTFEAQIYEYG